MVLYCSLLRWTSIRKAQAGMLLTKVFRMLIAWRTFNRAKKGTIRYQALARGYNARRVLAGIKVQKYYRMHTAHTKFTMLKAAILALQCAARTRTARKYFNELKKEQKDVGKLKQNNERLKEEMASLRAMLAAQAKESAAGAEHQRELQEKENRIATLEKRIVEIEKELAAAKKLVEQLESNLARQKEDAVQDKDQIQQLRSHRYRQSMDSPISKHSRKTSSGGSGALPVPLPDGSPSDYVSPEALAQHRAKVAILEEELEEERRLRRAADGEIIKLRAAINGVKLNEDDVKALLAPQLSGLRSEPLSEESSFADENEFASKRYVITVFGVFLLCCCLHRSLAYSPRRQGSFHFGAWREGSLVALASSGPPRCPQALNYSIQPIMQLFCQVHALDSDFTRFPGLLFPGAASCSFFGSDLARADRLQRAIPDGTFALQSKRDGTFQRRCFSGAK